MQGKTVLNIILIYLNMFYSQPVCMESICVLKEVTDLKAQKNQKLNMF